MIKTTLATLTAGALLSTAVAADEFQPEAVLAAYYGAETETESAGEITGTASMGRLGDLPQAAPKGAAFRTETMPDLAQQVAPCWVLPEAVHMPDVTLAFNFDDLGRPERWSIHLADASSGEETALLAAFTAARDAILGCSEGGYDLAEVEGEVELTFGADGVAQ
ncbi:MAG: hypothetical protein AAF748_17030 [Pseudomonadota bacterium]